MRRRWWLTFALLMSLGCLWAMAGPLFSVPDEPAHVVYAAAAIRGEVDGETEGIDTRVRVPTTYATADSSSSCFRYDGTVSASCAQPFAARAGTSEVITTAGRYPPAYYIAVGWATLVWDGAQAVFVMRFLTAGICAALIASAVVSAMSSRSRWPLVGVLTAVTPMAVFFFGAVNPQGPEIAAGVLLWSSGATWLLRRRSNPTAAGGARLLVRVLLAASVLAVIRPLSIVWLAAAVVILLIGNSRMAQVRQLLSLRWFIAGSAVVALLLAFTAVWILARDALAQWVRPSDLDLTAAALFSTAKLDDEVREMVGVFGWLDTAAPGAVFFIWLAVVGLLVLPALATGSGRQVFALLAILLGSVVVPVVSELTSYRESSFAWQGRYQLAFTAGVVVLAGAYLGVSRRADMGERLFRTVVGALAAAQLLAFVGNLNRYVRGLDGFWFVTPAEWSPPGGSVVLVVLCGLVLVASVIGLSHHRSQGSRLDAPEQPEHEPDDLTRPIHAQS